MCPKNSVPVGSSCGLCTLGRYQTTDSRTTCNGSCPLGQTSIYAGSSICQTCTYGTYSEPATASRCDPCPIGKYQPANGASFCFSCPGYHATNSTGSWGAFACTSDCITGTIPTGDSSCSPCSYGTYVNSKTTTCSQCPPGRYGSSIGANSEQDCFKCPTGTYNPDSGSTSGEACKKCVVSPRISCVEGSIAMTVDVGTWTDGVVASDCVPSIACSGGVFVNSSTVLCSEGYVGDVCSSCESDYFRLSGLCRKCISAGLRWFIVTVSVILGLFVIRILFKKGIRLPSSVKISIFWFQILSMYPMVFEKWPSELMTVFNFLSLTNLNIGYFGLGCDFRKSFFELTFIKLAFSPFIWCFLCAIEAITALRNPGGYDRLQENIDKITSQTLLIMNLFCLQIFSSLIQPLSCVESQGVFYLVADPSIRCFDASWFRSIGGVIFFFAIYMLVIPGFLFRRLYLSQRETTSTFHPLVDNLSASYRKGCKDYELYRIAFKFFFVIIRDALPSSRVAKTGLLLIIFSLELSFKGWMRPYHSDQTNGLSIM
jgi:hypothetical protein